MPTSLDYTGNAGLGLGSNPNIPVSADPNTFNILGQTARDLASWSNQQSAMLYNQKVQDRDKMLNMIATDQIATGDILPEYRPKVEEAIKEVASVFKEWKGNPNDTEGYMKYKDAQRKASDLAKIAQVNTQQIKANRLEKSKEPISYRQKDYDDFEKGELTKGLDDVVNPYQKELYLDADSMGKDLRGDSFGVTVAEKATTGKGKEKLSVSVSETGGLSPISKQPDKIFNYDNTLGRATMRFMERGAPAESQELLIEGFQQLPADKARKSIEGINERIRVYNEQTKGQATPVRELKEGEDFVEQVDPATGQRKIMIAEYTPEFAAKWALAQHPGDYVEKGAEVFNKEVGDYLNDNKKIAISREKLGIDKAKANEYIKNLRARTEKLKADGVSEDEVTSIANRFVDEVQVGMQVGSSATDASGKKVAKGLGQPETLFFIDNLPDGYQNVLMSVDEKGKLVNKKINPFVLNGKPVLRGEVYTSDGKKAPLSPQELTKAYQENVANGFNGTFEDYRTATNRYVSDQIKAGNYQVIMKDKDGNKIDISSIKDAYKNLNNATGAGKYKEKMFSETEEETEE